MPIVFTALDGHQDLLEPSTPDVALLRTDGTLIHGDLTLNNVLVDADTHQLRAIIDAGGGVSP